MSKKNAFEIMMKGAKKSAKIHNTVSGQSVKSINSSVISSSDKSKNIEKTDIFDYLLQFDGGSRGNPGIAGCGSVIYYKGNEIWNRSFYLGDNYTNNHAEYYGLIYGLMGAKELQIKNLIVQGDSKIIINQVTGKFKVKSDNLKPLYQKVINDLEYFENIRFEHIYRNINKRADKLANVAMDNKCN